MKLPCPIPLYNINYIILYYFILYFIILCYIILCYIIHLPPSHPELHSLPGPEDGHEEAEGKEGEDQGVDPELGYLAGSTARETNKGFSSKGS